MSLRSIFITVLLVGGFVACSSEPALVAEETSADSGAAMTDDTLYALGYALANQAAPFALTEDEIEAVKRGFEDGALGREAKVDMSAETAKLQTVAQARASQRASAESSEAQAFLDAEAAKEGVVVTDTGLIYTELVAGDGPSPAATDTVKVHYHGTLRDGTVFDSSVDRGQPATFPLNRVIACWTEGVQRMKVGGKAVLVCPSEIAYGERGAGAQIGPGAALKFEVELLEIVG
ncbi:MAG: FKBP-type peptidyl-prolyl cis-trans isomerase [Acidobacteriota bacterium]